MKRTLLLGAGAAAGCYDPALTTSSITAALRARGRWDALLTRYRTLMGDGNMIEPADVADLIQRLLNAKPSMTFEELIEGIDKVSSFHFTNDTKVLHALLIALGVKRCYPNTVWTDVPFLARQLVAEFVVEAPRSASCSGIIAAQRSFLAALRAEGPVCVYSLNYDETLYESTAGLDLDNGFRGSRFSVYDFLNAESVLAFPHGHVRYLYFGHDGVAYVPDGADATKQRFEHLQNPHNQTLTVVDHPYADVFDTFLITGQMKDHALDRNPYAATYQRLAQDLSTSDELIIVGFSLGDRHLNRLITNYLVQQPAHRIIIVTMQPAALDVYAAYRPGGWSYELLTTLGIGSLPLTEVGLDDIRYRYTDEVARINARGYGTVYPKITYFKDGYSSFLSNYEAVLAEAGRGKTGL